MSNTNYETMSVISYLTEMTRSLNDEMSDFYVHWVYDHLLNTVDALIYRIGDRSDILCQFNYQYTNDASPTDFSKNVITDIKNQLKKLRKGENHHESEKNR